MTSESDKEPQAKKSQAGTGIAIGTAIGVALGAAFDQLALGVAFGAALDVISHLRSKNRK